MTVLSIYSTSIEFLDNNVFWHISRHLKVKIGMNMTLRLLGKTVVVFGVYIILKPA